MQKVRLSTLKTHKIEMEDGSFVIVKGLMDYATYKLFMEKFRGLKNEKKSKEDLEFFNIALEFLKTIIIGWNFVDSEGTIISYKPELVDHLDIETINELMEKTMGLYMPQKKN